MFKLEVKNYPVFMYLGVLPAEKICGQTVKVSLEAIFETGDQNEISLDETVDYGRLMKDLDEVLVGQTIGLIENALNTVGEMLMAKYTILDRLTVSIEKPVLPGAIDKGSSVRISKEFGTMN